LDQIATQRIKKLVLESMSASLFDNLARSARDNVLVTFTTALRVVGGPETIGNSLDFLEEKSVVIEGTSGDDIRTG
jgi:hypothetical protein